MSKRNTWLVALLGFQVAFFGILGWVSGSRQQSRIEPTKLLAGWQPDQIKKIRIEDPEGASVVLERKDKDWSLPAVGGYPAARENVDRVLANLTGLESSYEVTRSADHHEELKVGKQFERKVTLEGAAGSKVLLVGTTGKGGMVHYRLADSSTVYAGEGVRSWDLATRVSEWTDKKYFELDKNKVIALDVRKGTSDLHLARATQDSWQLAGQKALVTEVNKLLDAATRLELSNVTGRADEKAALVKQSPDLVSVTLGLAAEPFKSEKPAADLGAADGPEGAPPAPPGAASSPPQVVAKKVLYLAPAPSKTTAYLAYLEGAPYVIEVDKYRVEDLLNADAKKILGATENDKASAPVAKPKKK